VTKIKDSNGSARYVAKIALNALEPADRLKIKIIAIVQIMLGLLDLIALAIIGFLGSLAVSGISSAPKESTINLLFFRNLGSISFQKQIAILGTVAALFLVGRTAVTMYLNRKTLYFLSMKSALLTATLARTLLNKDLLTVLSKSKQETLFALTGGVNKLIIGVLGAGIQMLADLSLLLIMLGGLFIFDPLISITSLILFGTISLVLYFLMHTRAATLGEISTDLNIRSSEKIIEVIDTYREAVVRNRRSYYADKISDLRIRLASAEAEIAFMPSISKYVIEISIVLGALLICGIQFALKDAIDAVATLAIFMTAGSRIAPAILRLQQSAVAIKTAVSSAGPSIRLIESMDSASFSEEAYSHQINTEHAGFFPEIEFKDVSFSYPNKEPAIDSVSFKVSPGQFIAVVGSSGAGKTTLVDLLLGILHPANGEILISGLPPEKAIKKWPGAISYVPQDVSLIKGSIRENIGLGFDSEELDEILIQRSLADASIGEFVLDLSDGTKTVIGDGGLKLSGGQKQRMGIARGLITNPQLLVLDEATSALDGQMESDITNTLFALRGKRTVLVIAHRLSSVREADSVIYLDKGRLIAQGTFSQVRDKVPDFEIQAKLMGL
jgi:ABC-type multidrug transport system fused ATPase/permease subunit